MKEELIEIDKFLNWCLLAIFERIVQEQDVYILKDDLPEFGKNMTQGLK